MAAKRTILVTGVTGQQGGAAAGALIARGHTVHGMTRNPDSDQAKGLAEGGIKPVKGDFEDGASLKEACTGVDTVFAMGTFFEAGLDAEVRQGKAIVDAAKAAGVGHFIYTSVGNANEKTGVPHFESKAAVEEHLVQSGLSYSIIGPVYFMENIISPWYIGGLKAGTFSQALRGDRKLALIAVADIGAFAAELVERRNAVFGQRWNLAGDSRTGDEIAAEISKASGKTISYAAAPIEAVRKQSEDMALMYEWFDKVGYSIDTAALRRDFPAVGWHSFPDWAAKQNWAALLA